MTTDDNNNNDGNNGDNKYGPNYAVLLAGPTRSRRPPWVMTRSSLNVDAVFASKGADAPPNFTLGRQQHEQSKAIAHCILEPIFKRTHI